LFCLPVECGFIIIGIIYCIIGVIIIIWAFILWAIAVGFGGRTNKMGMVYLLLVFIILIGGMYLNIGILFFCAIKSLKSCKFVINY
jgi:hypothetical protein